MIRVGGGGLIHRGITTNTTGAGVSPAQIGNLVQWLDAQDAGGFTFSTGTDVSQWNDKSGNGNHMVQATGSAQPLYNAATINGRPAVQFYDDSTFKQLACADNATMDYTALTAFIVVQRVSDLGAIEILYGKYATTSAIREFYVGISVGDAPTFTYSNDGTATAAASAGALMSIGTPYIITAQLTGTGGTSSCSLNNANTGGGTITGSIFNGAAPLVMGSINAGGALPASVHYGECLFYKAALTAAEIAQVHAYLSSKWGIAI